MNTLKKEYFEDLDFLIKKYEEIFPLPYYCFTKNELEIFINDYLSNNLVEKDLDFLYFLKCIIKKLNGLLDSHTSIKMKGQFFPFIFKMFNKDLYVVKTVKQTEQLLYCKLVSVNGVPYINLIPEIENIISYSTEGWRERCIERTVNELYSLLQLPSINSNENKIELEFKSRNGEKVFFVFLENDYQEGIPYDKENGTFEIFNSTVRYIYNSCKDEEKIINSLIQLKNETKNKQISNFILDLRGNTGGNDAIILPLIDYIKELNIKLFTFVDRYTFSSGIGALMDSIKIGAFVIGEGTGSSINHFGSHTADFILPNTNFKLKISTKYIDETNDEDYIKQNLILEKNEVLNMYPKIYIPNVVINETIDDYINSKDLCMEEFMKIEK